MKTGYIFCSLYIIATAISASFIHNIGTNIPLELMITMSSLYAICFFHLISIKKLANTYKKLLSIKKLYALVLSAFLLVWLLSYFISIYFTAAIVVFFIMAWPSCLGMFFQYRITGNKINRLASISILTTIIAFYICIMYMYPISKALILIASLTSAGIAAFGYIKFSHTMNEHNFNAAEILAVRYWLLLLVPLSIVIYRHELNLINSQVALITLALSVINLILPIYFAQLSIEKIGANLHSMLIGFTPFISFIMEIILTEYNKNIILDGVFSAILALILIMTYYLNYYYRFKKYK